MRFPIRRRPALPLALALLAVALVGRCASSQQGWRGPPPEAVRPAPDEGRVCRVAHVIDGDTIDVRCNGVRQRVRLLRVDTPEREQPGYHEARRALARLLADAQVRLVFEQPDRPERDDYGRLLAYAMHEDRNLNVELVREGWSRFFTRYGRGRFAAAFEDAEREARDAGRGIWGDRR